MMRRPRPRPGAVLLHWLFERLYRELAWAYDAVSWLVSGGRWRQWQRATIPYLVGNRILDVGTGPGHLLSDLRDAGFSAYGLEFSPAMWRQARQALRKHGLSGLLVGGDACRMPFADETFDSLVLTFPPPFVREPAFWGEAERVLRAGGRVVVVEGAHSNTRLWPGIVEKVWSALSGSNQQPEAVAPEAQFTIGAFSVRRMSSTAPSGSIWLIVAEKARHEKSALTDSFK
jgi:ubiquinone/menaquinone biosynthesis C-methylase UbiE